MKFESPREAYRKTLTRAPGEAWTPPPKLEYSPQNPWYGAPAPIPVPQQPKGPSIPPNLTICGRPDENGLVYWCEDCQKYWEKRKNL
jgi:hypothetical protein